MSDEPKPLSEWARKRAAGKARGEKSLKRREVYFDLLVSGYSVEQIAKAAKMSSSSVRRAINQALAERRFDAPEEFARLQVARLNKALRCADASLEGGDMKAIAPFLQVVSELNRLHGLGAGPLRLAPSQRIPKVGPKTPGLLAIAHEAGASGAAMCEDAKSCAKEVLTPSKN